MIDLFRSISDGASMWLPPHSNAKVAITTDPDNHHGHPFVTTTVAATRR